MKFEALLQLLHSIQAWEAGVVVQVTAAAIGDIARGTVVVTALQAKSVTAIVLGLAWFLGRALAALINIGISLSFCVTLRCFEVRFMVVERSGCDRNKVVVSVMTTLARWIGAKRSGDGGAARRHRLGVR